MIEPILGLPDGVVGVRVTGTFAAEDFSRVIEPEIARVEAMYDQPRVVFHVPPEFDGFGDGAWDEVTDEARHLKFHKGAVVTDNGTIRTTVNVLKWAMHGHVRTFRNDEFDTAVVWVAD
ncbi:MAG: STAS/SEC14 domain-containing protein [Ilumatobacteraceae bacterium]